MLTEGKGIIAPAKVAFRIDQAAFRLLLSEAKKRASFRGYKNRSSAWSQGLKNQIEIPGVGSITQDIRPILCGMLGEHAVSETINRRMEKRECEVDYSLRQDGDGGQDLNACGRSIQVKTRQSSKCVSLVDRVRFKGGRKRIIPIASRVYVFCEWVPQRNPLEVEIIGWAFGKSLSALRFVKSSRGDWFNIVIPDAALEPLGRLIIELRRDSCL